VTETKFDISGFKFDADGLLPAIAQDHKDGTVLMLAYMNLESLKMTLETSEVSTVNVTTDTRLPRGVAYINSRNAMNS
jgi:phosphoribosyl-AMP cyclohydrolase